MIACRLLHQMRELKELVGTVVYPWKKVHEILKPEDPQGPVSKQSFLKVLRKVLTDAVRCYMQRTAKNVFANEEKYVVRHLV